MIYSIEAQGSRSEYALSIRPQVSFGIFFYENLKLPVFGNTVSLLHDLECLIFNICMFIFPIAMAISITDNGEGLLSFLGECEERLREHILSAINQALKQAKETHEAAEEKSTGESYTLKSGHP